MGKKSFNGVILIAVVVGLVALTMVLSSNDKSASESQRAVPKPSAASPSPAEERTADGDGKIISPAEKPDVASATARSSDDAKPTSSGGSCSLWGRYVVAMTSDEVTREFTVENGKPPRCMQDMSSRSCTQCSICKGETKIGGATVLMTFKFDQGKLYWMDGDFQRSDFDAVRDATIALKGKPQTDAVGAPFDQCPEGCESIAWTGETDTLLSPVEVHSCPTCVTHQLEAMPSPGKDGAVSCISKLQED